MQPVHGGPAGHHVVLLFFAVMFPFFHFTRALVRQRAGRSAPPAPHRGTGQPRHGAPATTAAAWSELAWPAARLSAESRSSQRRTRSVSHCPRRNTTNS